MLQGTVPSSPVELQFSRLKLCKYLRICLENVHRFSLLGIVMESSKSAHVMIGFSVVVPGDNKKRKLGNVGGLAVVA